jgi:hypothetical protein
MPLGGGYARPTLPRSARAEVAAYRRLSAYPAWWRTGTSRLCSQDVVGRVGAWFGARAVAADRRRVAGLHVSLVRLRARALGSLTTPRAALQGMSRTIIWSPLLRMSGRPGPLPDGPERRTALRWSQRRDLGRGSSMSGAKRKQSTDPVADSTVDAVHRRDHQHGDAEACHPHLIEVVHLGRRAIAVCHDCRQDSGFLPERDADRLASAHRQETAGDAHSTLLPPSP